jgi:hypothetical protein
MYGVKLGLAYLDRKGMKRTEVEESCITKIFIYDEVKDDRQNM